MIEINDLEEMKLFAEKLANIICKPLIICLSGDLGAGKTSFASFFIKNKIGDEEVTSPTFGLIHEYKYNPPIAHLDLYRLNNLEELYQIGIEDYFDNYIILIEWPEIAEKILPKNYIYIKILFAKNDKRKLEIYFQGKEVDNIEELITLH